ncbi:MAG: flippase [Patescibacteria group bacterium]
MNQSATKKIALNTLVQSIAKTFVIVMGLVSVAILTRYLGAEGYGKFTLVLVYLSIFGIAADMGLFTISIREMSKNLRRTQEIFSNTLALRGLLGVIVLLIAIGVSWLLPYEPDVRIGIIIAGGAHLFGLLNSAMMAVFQSRLVMGYAAIADLAGRAIALGAVIAVAALGLGFYAVVATASLGAFVTFLVSTWLVRRYVRVKPMKDLILWKGLLREALPYGLTLVVVQLYFRVDILLLSFFKTNADVGIYGAVFKVFELLMVFSGFFNNSTFPILNRRLKESSAKARAFTQKSFNILFIGGLGIAAGSLTIAPFVMRIVGGQEFVAGSDALRVVLLTMPFTFSVLALGSLLLALGKQKVMLRISTYSLVLNIVLNLFLIPPYGFIGAAVATLISEVFLITFYYRYTRKLAGFSLSPAIPLRAVAAAVVMVAVMLPLMHLPLLAFLAGSTTYLGGLVLFRAVDKDTLKELVGMLRKRVSKT